MGKKPISIWGAGLSGLSAAETLTQRGYQVKVFEQKEIVGGLARSFPIQSIHVDLGPHRFITKDKETLEWLTRLMRKELLRLARKSEIYISHTYFTYPLQIHDLLDKMSLKEMGIILLNWLFSYTVSHFQQHKEKNFHDWVAKRYGEPLYALFFKPYTEKLWGQTAEMISADWAVQRIAFSNPIALFIKEVLRKINTHDDIFYYPKEGGIGTFARLLTQQVTRGGGAVLTCSSIEKIHLARDTISSFIYNEHEEETGHVFSTIPISSLIEYIDPPVPQEVREAAKNLKFRSLIFLFLKIRKARLSHNHWIYFPEKDVIFNRLTEYKNFYPDGNNSDTTLISLEITCYYGDDIWNAPRGKLYDMIRSDLQKMKISPDEIENMTIRKERYAYPFYSLDYAGHLHTIFTFLKKIQNLTILGRNGLFKYNNMDHSIKMGLTAGRLFDIEANERLQDIICEIGDEKEYIE